jgi:hypothetical protein
MDARGRDQKVILLSLNVHNSFQRVVVFFPLFRIADEIDDLLPVTLEKRPPDFYITGWIIVGDAATRWTEHKISLVRGRCFLPQPASVDEHQPTLGAAGRRCEFVSPVVNIVPSFLDHSVFSTILVFRH